MKIIMLKILLFIGFFRICEFEVKIIEKKKWNIVCVYYNVFVFVKKDNFYYM